MKKEKIILLSHSVVLILIALYGSKISFSYLIVLLLYFLIFKLDKKESLEVLLIMAISIPYGGGLNSVYQIQGFKFSELIILCYFIRFILKNILSNKKIKVIKLLDILIILFTINIFLNLFIISTNIFDGIKEMKMIIIPVFTYFLIRFLEVSILIEDILGILIKSTCIGTGISIIIYHLGDLEKLNLILTGNRYGFAFYSLFIITIPYIINKIRDKSGKNKTFYFFTLLLQCYAIVLSQNRSIILSIIIIMFIDFIISIFKYSKSYLELSMKIFIIASIFVILIFFLKEVLESTSGILYRFRELIEGNGIATLKIRQSTNSYYINEIINNLFGYGLGEKMTLVNQYETANYGNVWAIDNVFIAIGFKLGVVALVIYIMILINAYVKFILFKSKSRIIYSLIYIIPIFIIVTGVINAQILYNTSIAIFMWVFCAVLLNKIYYENSI